MKFKINLETSAVEQLRCEFEEIPDISFNGQHFQLAGHALAEYEIQHQRIILYHPETEPTCGHYDVDVILSNTGDIKFRRYSHFQEITLEKIDDRWPSGGWNLLQVIDAIEQFMTQEATYRPVLRGWILAKLSN